MLTDEIGIGLQDDVARLARIFSSRSDVRLAGQRKLFEIRETFEGARVEPGFVEEFFILGAERENLLPQVALEQSQLGAAILLGGALVPELVSPDTLRHCLLLVLSW